jgi:hypothetical protein
LGERAEKPFDAAAAPGHAGLGKHQPHLEVHTDLLQMVRGKVASVIRVKRLRDPAEVPLGSGFAPDGLPQYQRRLPRGGGLKTHPNPCNRPTVIIHDDGEPRSGRFPGVVEEPDIEQRMISLPHLVGMTRFAAVHELKRVPIGFRPRMGHGPYRRIELLHHRIDTLIAGG